MAKLTSGIFGPISGKVGGLVGAHWKNMAYIRTLPRKTAKNSTPTPAQLACRAKFKFIQEFLVPFYPFITVGFKNLAIRKTEINAAFSENFKQIVTGAYPDFGIKYSGFMLSKGTLPQLIDVQGQIVAADLVKLTWLSNSLGTFDDQLMLVLYSDELKMADGFVGGVNRRDKECIFRFNPKLIGKSLHVYFSVISLNGSRVADSKYLGRIDPL